MKLILLGTNGFMPTNEAQTASYLLPEPGILLDAGSGTYRLPDYLQYMPLDVYLSHAHGDHTNGLTYLFASYFKKIILDSELGFEGGDMANFMKRANDALHRTRIHGMPSTLAEVQETFQHFDYQYVPLDYQESLAGGGVLTYFPLEHGPMECVGYRLEWPGHCMAYVTDTVSRPDSAYIRHLKGVDLLLHECNNPDRKSEMAVQIHHTYTSMAARVAALAGVKRLVLIHKSPFEALDIHPDLEAARQIFPNIEIGQDGMQLDF